MITPLPIDGSGALILDSILRSAVDATGAANGWIVVRSNGSLFVAAVMADSDLRQLRGTIVSSASSAGFCMASGEPAARQPRPDDSTAADAAGYRGVPSTLLTVPCVDDEHGTVGVLELAEKSGSAFSLDDVELVSLLANVAGTVIATASDGNADEVTAPTELAAELTRLYGTDRRRYTLIANTVLALLGSG